MTWSHDSKKVISGDWTGSVKVWDAATGAELAQLQSNPPAVADQIALSKQRLADLLTGQAGLTDAITKAAAATAAGRKALEDQKAALANDQKNKATIAAAVAAADKKLNESTAAFNAAKASVESKQADVNAKNKEIADLGTKRAALMADITKWENEMKARAEVLGKAMGNVQNFTIQTEQLPEDASLKQALSQAQVAQNQAQAAVDEADKNRKAAGGQIPGIDQKVAQLKQAVAMQQTNLKAAQLVYAEANKVVAASKAAADAEKAKVAPADKAIENRNNAIKAATDRINQLVAAENTAKAAAEKSKQDTVFVQYQVEKWAAAAVNLELHEESEELGTYREKLIGIEGQAQKAVAEHQAAEKARVEAEQTLASAEKTVADGTTYLATAKEDVLAKREREIAARALGKLIEQEEPVVQIEVAAVETIQSEVTGFQQFIESAFQKAVETDEKVREASKLAAETKTKTLPERKKVEESKKTVMQKALEAKQQQETQLQDQTKRVDELEKKYKDMFVPPPAQETAQN
ncbi:MAG: hypothetical protein AAF585_12665 [Verrucomicrobiota bacterium]